MNVLDVAIPLTFGALPIAATIARDTVHKARHPRVPRRHPRVPSTPYTTPSLHSSQSNQPEREEARNALIRALTH